MRAQRKITPVMQQDAVDANSPNVQAFNLFMKYPESDFL
jgi:hypothetical protein